MLLAAWQAPANQISTPQQLPIVNVLTWWGYLDYPEVKNLVMQQCHAKLSYDEYYSDEEFLHRFAGKEHTYDIIIFSDTLFNQVKDRANYDKSDLWMQSKNYNETIRKHYESNHFPPNFVYYTHALSGFLWNPAIISLDETDSVFSMFKKAGTNLVVIPDDPLEVKMLMGLGADDSKVDRSQHMQSRPYSARLTMDNFSNLVQSSKLYITNDYSEILEKPNFAFAFTWSGEAIEALVGPNKQYRFSVHPDLSYISTDILGVLNGKSASVCVAKALTSKKAMEILQNRTFYFSPYADDSGVTNPRFKRFYKNFLQILPNLKWIDPISKDEFKNIKTIWQTIRVKFTYGK